MNGKAKVETDVIIREIEWSFNLGAWQQQTLLAFIVYGIFAHILGLLV